MGQKTPLFEIHKSSGAKIVDFGGWDMPLHYGSQIDEHHYVRNEAGMFDVSHMTVIDVTGEDSQTFLDLLLANDIKKLRVPGKALYSCMLNHDGGVIDDLIVYFFAPNDYRLVVNASTREKDLAWIKKQADPFDVRISECTELSMLAIQGPMAMEKVASVVSEPQVLENLKAFFASRFEEWLVARTGYTGEDGVEICLPNEQAPSLWHELANVGVHPCGLGARDTLRLEAGMNLYGNDMDETTSPLVSGLSWTVAMNDIDSHPRGFIGAQSLRDQLTLGITQEFLGVVLEGRGVLRGGQTLHTDDRQVGTLTSGSFSPTLKKAIGFARVEKDLTSNCEVEIRGRRLSVGLTQLPFVRRGKVLV